MDSRLYYKNSFPRSIHWNTQKSHPNQKCLNGKAKTHKTFIWKYKITFVEIIIFFQLILMK